MSINNKFEYASCNENALWEINFSHYKHICFKSAMRNHVFDIVEKMQPIDRNELIKQAKYGKRGGEAVINVVTAADLLKCIDGKYYLTELSRNFLTESSVFSWRPMTTVSQDRFESELKKIESEAYVIKDGLIDKWEIGAVDPEMAVKFTQYMQCMHTSAAIGFAKNIDLNKFGVKSFMDVAGGSGCFSIAAAHHQPGVKAVIFELAPVCNVAQSFIDKSGLEKDRVITCAGNMFKDDFPLNDDPKYGYQATFYSNVFHDWNDEKCKYLTKKSYDALPENGMIFLHEALLNDDGNGPLVTACFSFHMFLRTEGKQFTFSELKDILTNAGFKDIGVVPTYGYFSVIYGRK